MHDEAELMLLKGDVIYDGMACRTMNDVTADCNRRNMKKKNKREPDDSRTEQKHTSGLYPEATNKTYSGIRCRTNRQRAPDPIPRNTKKGRSHKIVKRETWCRSRAWFARWNSTEKWTKEIILSHDW